MLPKHPSPLLSNIIWPDIYDDSHWVEGFYSKDWPWYITAYLRRHLFTQEKNINFFFQISNDKNKQKKYVFSSQKFSLLLSELYHLFHPVSLTHLYYQCLSHYRDLIDTNINPFVQNWYIFFA